MLLDTGCYATILNTTVYLEGQDKLEDLDREKRKFNGAAGEGLIVHGKKSMPIRIGRETTTVDMVIADIVADGILGLGAMRQLGCTLDFENNHFRIKGCLNRVYRTREGSNSQAAITIASVVRTNKEELDRETTYVKQETSTWQDNGDGHETGNGQRNTIRWAIRRETNQEQDDSWDLKPNINDSDTGSEEELEPKEYWERKFRFAFGNVFALSRS